MSTLRVHWTIAPAIAPRPLINCNRCGDIKPYRCSKKFRVNANGKRIDVWLIYRFAWAATTPGISPSWNDETATISSGSAGSARKQRSGACSPLCLRCRLAVQPGRAGRGLS
ncbi:hypothetical protein ACVOMV_04880 [Mesorhizobium atlanticum]